MISIGACLDAAPKYIDNPSFRYVATSQNGKLSARNAVV